MKLFKSIFLLLLLTLFVSCTSIINEENIVESEYLDISLTEDASFFTNEQL